MAEAWGYGRGNMVAKAVAPVYVWDSGASILRYKNQYENDMDNFRPTCRLSRQYMIYIIQQSSINIS